VRKGSHQAKCRRGHSLEGTNIIRRTRKDGTLIQECRTCANAGFARRRKLKAEGQEPKRRGRPAGKRSGPIVA